MITVYIATPITSRSEYKLEDRFQAAKKRIEEIEKQLREYQASDPAAADLEVEYTSAFTVGCEPQVPEATAMGRCVTQVVNSDIVVLDAGWDRSRGCKIEREVAKAYHKTILPMRSTQKRYFIWALRFETSVLRTTSK